MTPAEAVQTVNKFFKYETDKEQYNFNEVWRIMRPNRMTGDCEDYALTVLFLIANRSYLRMFLWLLTRKAKILHLIHKETGEGHAVLEYKDKQVDNILRYWNEGTRLRARGYEEKFSWPVFMIFFKFLIAMPFVLLRK